MGNKKEIYEELENVMGTLSKVSKTSEIEKVDVLMVNKAIEMIDSVAWKYEEGK